MKQYRIILYIAFIAVLVSCKKENAPSVTAVNKTTQQKLQTWFESQSKLNPSGIQPVLGSNTPNWGETEFVEGENMYLTPVTLKENGHTAKYFVARTENNGTIKSGGYYVFLNKKGISAEDANNIVKGNSPNTSFTGAVLEYDIKDRLIKASHYANGKISNNENDNVFCKPSNAKAVKSNENGFANECEEGVEPFCIDWYWQTYVNGVLVDEEYLYSTCYCGNGGSGGNSGNSGNSTVICNQVNENFINQGQAINGNATEVTLFSDGTIWEKGYNWAIFTAATWGLISYEKGSLKKVHYPNNISLWEFQSFQHLMVLETGIVIGGTRTYSIVPPVINISPSKTSVDIHIDFTISSKATCCPTNPIAIPYNANKHFTAPNSFVIIPTGQ